MGRYRIVYRHSVEKDLRKIPRASLEGVIKRIQGLADDPYGAGTIKLRGGAGSLYRIRHGDYRIIYEVNDAEVVVLVVKVGHRRDVYSER